jgi:hypothetical protein
MRGLCRRSFPMQSAYPILARLRFALFRQAVCKLTQHALGDSPSPVPRFRVHLNEDGLPLLMFVCLLWTLRKNKPSCASHIFFPGVITSFCQRDCWICSDSNSSLATLLSYHHEPGLTAIGRDSDAKALQSSIKHLKALGSRRFKTFNQFRGQHTSHASNDDAKTSLCQGSRCGRMYLSEALG